MPRLPLQALMLSANAAGELPEGSILSFDKKLLYSMGIQWINILLLTAILVFILYKPVKKFMAERTGRIQKEIENAKNVRQQALELKEQYERMINGVEKEREEILRSAHKKAMAKSDQLLFEAKRQAEAMSARAMAELEKERQNAFNEMRMQMIEISSMMAGRLVEVSVTNADKERYIDQAFCDWEEIG